MTEEDAQIVGNAILSEVAHSLSIPGIRGAAAAAGMDPSKIPATSEAKGGMGSRAEVMPAVQKLFGDLTHERKETALPILAEQVMARSDEAKERLVTLLARHGYQFYKGALIKMGVLDEREAAHLPQIAASELAKAIGRLANGDESGAITAACGAVDATTTSLYEKHKLGDPGGSFQAKVNTVLGHLKVFDRLEQELKELKLKPEDARKIREEIEEATKHATEALQVIRRTNGDVHGTKGTYTRVVYDTIKWASAICGLLKGE